MSDTPHLNPFGVPLLEIGRDVQGRFRKNNKGGPGNPFARKVAGLRKALNGGGTSLLGRLSRARKTMRRIIEEDDR